MSDNDYVKGCFICQDPDDHFGVAHGIATGDDKTREDADRARHGEVVRWADRAMYDAEEMPFDVNETGPRVTLLNATPQPLAAIAAMSMMYEGKVARDLGEITAEQREHYFEQIRKTHLKAPFESVSLHFLIEGVTRSFTHQMVRQRTAVYAQESLRFAVKDHIDEEVALPPSLRDLAEDDPRVVIWRRAVNKVDDSYNALVSAGVPAEDARGLLPHNITTRLHYVTNLRGLQDHGGMRLCTQAQFEWRVVWDGIIRAIAGYSNPIAFKGDHLDDGWEFQKMATLFRPVCYLTGKCEFNAVFDRACSIKARVTANHERGRPSSEWHNELDAVEGNPIVSGVGPRSVVRDESNAPVFIGAIHPAEWMLDHGAAREK